MKHDKNCNLSKMTRGEVIVVKESRPTIYCTCSQDAMRMPAPPNPERDKMFKDVSSTPPPAPLSEATGTEDCKCELDGFLGAVTSQNCSIHKPQSPETEEWEKEFNVKYKINDLTSTESTDNPNEQIKSFIRSLLARAKEEERARIKKLAEEEKSRLKADLIYKELRDLALDELIKKI